MAYPVTVTVQPCVAGRNRLTTAFRIILAIPHIVLVGGVEYAGIGRGTSQSVGSHGGLLSACFRVAEDGGAPGDVIAMAVGRPGALTGAMVRPGVAILDFGASIVDGKMVGDVDYASVEPIAGAITPVPGGTGPMTNVMLLKNTLRAYEWRHASGFH